LNRILAAPIVLALAAGSLAAPPRYRAAILPQLDNAPEAPITNGYGLNNLGEVVGSYGFPDQGYHWSPVTGAHRLADIFGWDSSIALDINDSGQIAGFFREGEDASQPFVATIEGSLTLLPKLIDDPAFSAVATGISENGLVAGYCATEPDSFFGVPTRAAFWRDAVLTDVGTLGGEVAAAAAVNDAGVVVGYSQEAGIQAVRAFRWTESGGFDPLPRWEDERVTMAFDINESGFIAGAAETVTDEGYIRAAAIWAPDGMLTTFPLAFPVDPSFPYFAEAVAINESMQAVGSELDPDPFVLHAMLWQDGQPYILADLIDDFPEELQLSNAYDINDEGQILAWAFDSLNVQFVAVLLTPICAADMNGDGQLNLFDFLAFQSAFSNEDPAADLAEPFGTFNIFDFLAFQTAYGQGC